MVILTGFAWAASLAKTLSSLYRGYKPLGANNSMANEENLGHRLLNYCEILETVERNAKVAESYSKAANRWLNKSY